MPVVSVIVPIFNVEQYIARCARSLFGQRLEDMEFIFVDDCTPDHSMDFLRKVLEEEFPHRKSQVRFYRMPENSGLYKVRWQGIQMATGDYIIPCDSDDYVETEAYRLMYEKAVEGDYDIVACDFYKEDFRRSKVIKGEAKSINELLSGKAPWNLCIRLVRRHLLQEDIVPPVASNGEDMCFTLQASLKAKSFGHIDLPLYHYCYNEDSITRITGYSSAVHLWESFMRNASIILELLINRYGYPPNHPSIVLFKYYCRLSLRHYVQTREGYRLWRSTYPEVDKVLLFTPGVTFEEKFWFVLIHLHMYGFVKSITNHLRERV